MSSMNKKCLLAGSGKALSLCYNSKNFAVCLAKYAACSRLSTMSKDSPRVVVYTRLLDVKQSGIGSLHMSE